MTGGLPLPTNPGDPVPTGGHSIDSPPMPRWKRSGIIMAGIVVLLLIIETVDAAMDYDLNQDGIVPRQVSGLDGILWAPFLHADFAHLLGNLIPGVVLGFLLLMSRRFLSVTAIVWVISGFGVWLTGPSGIPTIGASGIIFGWLTYLLVRGLFNRDVWQVLGGVVLFAVYGGILWGVLPQGAGVSWQGHLFGAVGGVLAAWMLNDRRGNDNTAGSASAQIKGGSR